MKPLTVILPDAVYSRAAHEAEEQDFDVSQLCAGVLSDYFLDEQKPAESVSAAAGQEPEPLKFTAPEFNVADQFPGFPELSVELAQRFVDKTVKFGRARPFRSRRGIGFDPNFVFIEYLKSRSGKGGITVSFYGEPHRHSNPPSSLENGLPGYSRAKISTVADLERIIPHIRQAYGLKFGRIEELTLKHDAKNIGLLKIIYGLRQNIDVQRIIGLNVPEMKIHGISEVFWGYVQTLALESTAIAVCKIFEFEKRNDLNSIAGIINSLPDEAYSAAQLRAIERFASKYGVNRACTAPKQFLRDVAADFQDKHQRSLDECKEFRDKFAVHSEFKFLVGSLPSQDEFEAIFDFSADFYRLVSESILDVGPALIGAHVGAGLVRIMTHMGVPNPKAYFPKGET